MKLGTIYEISFVLTTLLALSSVVTRGQANVFTYGCLCGLALTTWLKKHPIPLMATWALLIVIGSFFYGGLILWQQGFAGFLPSMLHVVLGTTFARLCLRESFAHDRQVLILSLLILFAGGIVDQRLYYAVIFVGYTIALVWTLVTGNFLNTNDTTPLTERRDIITPGFLMAISAVAMATLGIAGILFVLFPRIGLGNFGTRQSTQLPDRISLLDPLRANLNHQVTARVTGLDYEDFKMGLYLRAAIYPQATPTGFQADANLSNHVPRAIEHGGSSNQKTYEVFLYPTYSTTLPSLGPVFAARIFSGGEFNPNLLLRVSGLGLYSEVVLGKTIDTPVRYEMMGELSLVGTVIDKNPQPAIDKFREIPKSLDPRIENLLQPYMHSKMATPEKVKTIRDFLLANYTYSLDKPLQDDTGVFDPLVNFLFHHKQGHCEYFATSFALLLRTVGIASRVASGYHGGAWDENGQLLIFTGSHAHAWVEWYDPIRGWITDDATPPAELRLWQGMRAWFDRMNRVWDDYVLDYNLNQQFALLQKMKSVLPEKTSLPSSWRINSTELLKLLFMFLFAVLVLALAILFYRRTRPKTSRLERVLSHVLSRVQKKPLVAGETFREVYDRYRFENTDRATIIYRAIVLYEECHYGNLHLEKRILKRTLKNLQDLNF